MKNAVCVICSDLFSCDSDVAIIIKCGHSFHSICLEQWLERKRNCPHCRVTIPNNNGYISKIFFQYDESDVDEATLTNQLSNLRVQLKVKEKEAKELNQKLEISLSETVIQNEKVNNLENLLTNERKKRKSLEDEVTLLQNCELKAYHALEETKNLKSRLRDLEAVDNYLKDAKRENKMIANLDSQTREQLLEWCQVLSKEIKVKQKSNNELKQKFDTLKKEVIGLRKNLITRNNEISCKQNQINLNEETIKNLEEKVDVLQKKIEALSKAIDSPSETRTSFAHRLLKEHPIPLENSPCFLKPSKTNIKKAHKDIALTNNENEENNDNQVVKRLCLENVNIDSPKLPSHCASLLNGQTKSSVNSSNIGIFKSCKSFPTDHKKQLISNGYNGLGGRQNFINVPKKKIQKKVAPLFAKQKSITLKKPSSDSELIVLD